MEPADVAANPALRERFLVEVACRDGAARTRGELELTRRALASEEWGERVIAWLWPDRTYDPGFDPFEQDGQSTRSPDEWRQMLADGLLELEVTAQQEAARSRDDLLAHVRWTARLSAVEQDRLRDGYNHPELMRLVLDSLQVEFSEGRGWVLRDPERLGRRIDQSRLASQIAEYVRWLPIEKMTRLIDPDNPRRLPQATDDPVPASDPTVYVAPAEGSPYRPLYEALAEDERSQPLYEVETGELKLPDGWLRLPKEALEDSTNWWYGRRVDDQNPQAAAWLAAGFEAGVPMRTDQNGLSGVGFRALPGRQAWRADPDRLARGTYRMPDTVPIRHGLRREPAPSTASERRSGNTSAVRGGALSHGPDPEVPLPKIKKSVPDDLVLLVDYLRANGDASRAQIEGHLRQSLGDLKPAEITNLLTRARRRRLAVNHGSDTRPQWVAIGSKGDLMIQIGDALDAPVPLGTVGPGLDLPEVFVRRVWEAVNEQGQLLDPALVDEPNSSPVHTALERVVSALERVSGSRGRAVDVAALQDLRDAASDYAALTEPYRKAQLAKFASALKNPGTRETDN